MNGKPWITVPRFSCVWGVITGVYFGVTNPSNWTPVHKLMFILLFLFLLGYVGSSLQNKCTPFHKMLLCLQKETHYSRLMKEKWVTFFQGDFLVFPFKYKKCCCWDISLLRLCGKQLVAIDTTPTPLRQRISQEERYLQTLCWHELIFTVATKYSWSWTGICVISDDDSISTSVWFGLTKTAHTCHGTSHGRV